MTRNVTVSIDNSHGSLVIELAGLVIGDIPKTEFDSDEWELLTDYVEGHIDLPVLERSFREINGHFADPNFKILPPVHRVSPEEVIKGIQNITAELKAANDKPLACEGGAK